MKQVVNPEQMLLITTADCKLFNWLPVCKHVIQISLCHIFKVKHGLSSHYVEDCFVMQEPLHSHNTMFS